MDLQKFSLLWPDTRFTLTVLGSVFTLFTKYTINMGKLKGIQKSPSKRKNNS